MVINEASCCCYIVSEADTHFTIQWKDHNGMHHSGMRCLIDGFSAGSTICPPNGVGQRVGEFVSEERVRPYVFGSLMTSEDDMSSRKYLTTAPEEKVGSIEVRVIPVHVRDGRVPFKPSPFAVLGPWAVPVSERSKKAGAHCVKLGRAVKSKCEQRGISPINPQAAPYVTFMFSYSSQALLQARGIISPGTTLSALSGKLASGLALRTASGVVGGDERSVMRAATCLVKIEED
ncbi:hypothetical protein OH77DRAFT_1430938 [Trametes cingulata]|nr:hypothetical protein OH77DRAFT_1430938 [Trametes cingulata]